MLKFKSYRITIRDVVGPKKHAEPNVKRREENVKQKDRWFVAKRRFC